MIRLQPSTAASTDQPDLDIHEKESIFAEIDKLESQRNKDLEIVLMEVLPKAFAIMRETARRFKENEYLEVTATEHDGTLAAKYQNVKINGDKAQWSSSMDGCRQYDHLGHGAL